MLKHGFGSLLLVALQFAVEFDLYRVEMPPSVHEAKRDLVSFAKFYKLVEKPPRDEVVPALLFQTAYLSRDVANPFAPVVPHFIVRVGKDKALVQFLIENGRQPLNRYFNPLREQDVDVPDEHFQNPSPDMRIKTIIDRRSKNANREGLPALADPCVINRRFTAHRLMHCRIRVGRNLPVFKKGSIMNYIVPKRKLL